MNALRKFAVLATAICSLSTGCARDKNSCGPKTPTVTTVYVDPPAPATAVITVYRCSQCKQTFDPSKGPCSVCTRREATYQPYPQTPVTVQQNVIIQQQPVSRCCAPVYEDVGGYYINIQNPPGSSAVFQNRIWVTRPPGQGYVGRIY